MRPFDRQRILLGVTSGVASYTVARLTQPRAEVDASLVRAASDFIGAFSRETLTRRPVLAARIAPDRPLNHIALARAARPDVVIPATAEHRAWSRSGHDDDLLPACLLCTSAPALLVPAINDRIRAHPQVRRSSRTPRSVGHHIHESGNGALAVGAGSGPGPTPETATIGVCRVRVIQMPAKLQAGPVTVAAGPACEPIISIRFRSNRSSRMMGAASASAAWRRDAGVTNSMAAAPAEFCAAAPANIKIKKSDDSLVTTRVARSTPRATVPALKTGVSRARAYPKLTDNGLNAIVAGDAMEIGAGFAVNTNRVTIAHADGRHESLPLQGKPPVATEILDRVEVLPHGC